MSCQINFLIKSSIFIYFEILSFALDSSIVCQFFLQTAVNSARKSIPASGHVLVRHNSTATFETRPYKLHKLEEAPAASSECTREDALLYYKQMQMVRRIESAAGNLYKEKVRKNMLLVLYSASSISYSCSLMLKLIYHEAVNDHLL